MMRRFLPAVGGGVEPSSSSSSTGGQRGEAEAAGLRFGGGDISLGPHGGGGGGHHLQDGSVDLLARHSSSPAGFFSNLMASNGFPGSKGGGGSGAEAHHHHPPSMAGSGSGSGGRKMKSQLSFTAGPPHLSHIAEDGAFPDRAGAEASVPRTFSAGGGSGGGFSIVGPWEESRDIISTLGGYESQFGGMASTSALEMAGMDRYLQLQHDQVPFKVRAKRGCATHPRSIAERVRSIMIKTPLYILLLLSSDLWTHEHVRVIDARRNGGRELARSSGSCRSWCPTWTSKQAPRTCWTLQLSTSRVCKASCRL